MAALFVVPAVAHAQAPVEETSIPPVVVTARPHSDGSLVVPSNEQEAERLRQIPGNVTLVPAEQWRDRAGVVGIPDMLTLVPSVFSGPKWGEDSRLSIRGSGLARNFHLRGVLLLQDGIPLNQADGSGDFQELDALAILRAEVLRGGNAFYIGGNALGGAIRFTTPTGRTNPGLVLRGEAGSFGFVRGQAAYGTAVGNVDIWASQTGMYQDGFRDHSAGRSYRFNSNLGVQLSDNAETRFYFSYNNIYQQIPGTVSRTQALTNPQAAFPTNVLLNYQRNIESVRIGNRTAWRPYQGLLLEAGFGFVDRQLDHPIFQYLDNHTQDWVLFLRGTADGEVLGLRNTLRFGANGVTGTNANNRYVNLSGRPGRLTYSSFDRASGGDVYAENSLYLLPDLAFVAGVQLGQSYRSSTDHFLQDGNQSGSARYGWANPRFGLLWNATSTIQGFANVTWSTEVPTLSDLIPLVSSAIGFNNLKPQRAMTLEFGTRGAFNDFVWELAAFRSWINDEIQLFTIGQNQSFALNAQSTLHTGVEASLAWTFGRNTFARDDRFVLRQAFTWGSYVFDNDPVWRNNQIPGIPSVIYQAELRYTHPAGAFIAPTVNWIPQAFYVDNANTLRTDAYALVGLRAGWEFGNGLSIYADARNLGDTKYISSASVVPRAVPNQPLMEPGFGRSIYTGIQFRF